jgi:hypothetical protein
MVVIVHVVVLFLLKIATRAGVTPRPDWILQEYGAGNISHSATNIIFSNGLLDPVRSAWSFVFNL